MDGTARGGEEAAKGLGGTARGYEEAGPACKAGLIIRLVLVCLFGSPIRPRAYLAAGNDLFALVKYNGSAEVDQLERR